MTHKIGDIVTPNPDAGWPRNMIGSLYVITAVPSGARGVNYKASPCDAEGNVVAGKGLRGRAVTLAAPTTSDVVMKTYVPNPAIGAIVRVPEYTGTPAGLYVVIGETDADRVRVVALDDATGCYWRTPSRLLTVLDPRNVIEALAEL